MKSYDKESIFWYGLHLLAEDQQLKYYISTEKQLIFNLYPLVYLGIIQYSLYRGEKIKDIESQEINEVTEYIVERLDQIYVANYKFVKNKPRKIVVEDESALEQIKAIIAELLIPYINKYCFKKLSEVYKMNSTFIRKSIINFEYDINHQAEDGKLKTSILYPFLFTINFIKIYDKNGLYQRVLKYYPREILLKKYETGREWKEKEVEYLQETYELLNNDEEWTMFLSNFANSKWEVFSIRERYKALFQLTKVTTILMKNDISSITMLADGEEVYDMLYNYLPLFIDYDRHEQHAIENRVPSFLNDDHTIFVPFSFQSINLELLIPYIKSKGERHIKIDNQTLEKMHTIIFKVISKIKEMIFIHEYLPKLVNLQIKIRKKVYVDLLDIFTETSDEKFKPKTDAENFNESLFFVSEEDIEQLLNLDTNNQEALMTNETLLKLAKISSYLLALKKYTARTVNYDIKELIKYILVIFGPHPIGHTFLTAEVLDKVFDIFQAACGLFEKTHESAQRNEKNELFFKFFELPVKLLNWENQ